MVTGPWYRNPTRAGPSSQFHGRGVTEGQLGWADSVSINEHKITLGRAWVCTALFWSKFSLCTFPCLCIKTACAICHDFGD